MRFTAINHNRLLCYMDFCSAGPAFLETTGLTSSEIVGLIVGVVSGGTTLILIVFTITFVCR